MLAWMMVRMPTVAKELKDIDLRRKTYRTGASGKTAIAFYSVGGVSGLQLRCAPPKGAGKKGSKSWILRVVIGCRGSDLGPGGYPSAGLSKARGLAREKITEGQKFLLRVIVLKGSDCLFCFFGH